MKKLGKFVFHTLLNILTGWVFAVKMLFFKRVGKKYCHAYRNRDHYHLFYKSRY